MSETLFAFDERNYQKCQTAFRGENNQEYYLGDYSIAAGSVIDVRADKKAVGCYSIIRLRSKTALFFRRSWSHIREDATDVTVLWFVKRGRLSVSHQRGSSDVEAGEFAVTCSMTPFAIECHPDQEGLHEVFHVLVPSHVLRRFINHDVTTGFSVPAQGRHFEIAQRILTDVFEDANELADHTALLLVESALALLTDVIKDRNDSLNARQTLAEKRLQDVLRYIEIHLSDPRLSTSMVADACGISTRYLSHLLKQHGTSFSSLVWDQRLKEASRWLASTSPNEISIAEIAFRVGFKSPAHFSRLFKRVFNEGPREYRSSCLAQKHRELLAGTVSGTLQ